MKQLILFVALLAGTLLAGAQTGAEKLRDQAARALEAKEYTSARFYYLKAYQGFADAGVMDKAVDCAVNGSALYYRENYYKEAFEALSRAEAALNAAESAGGKAMPALHYPIARERQRMYIKLKNSERAADQLSRMQEWATAAADRNIDIDLLSASAQQYYAFGQTDKGDAAVNKLIALYLADRDYDKADECYKGLIDMATRSNNARLVGRTYEKYLAWNDSIAAVRAAEKYAALNADYEAAQQTIADRDSSLTARTAMIVGLCVLAGALAVALIIAVGALLKARVTVRRQKREIADALRREEIKNGFVTNISRQMAPAIDTLDASRPEVKALRDFIAHIQTLTALETHRTERLETAPVNMASFCESVAAEVEPMLRQGVKLTVNAPKMPAPVAEEELREVLLHLLRNAAEHTPADGKITLDFKKRGPHNIQFIVTDSGEGVPEEIREDLFMPFARIHDLRQGDGLGLPTAALRVERMNGTLTLDTSFRQGARFVIELHP